VDACAILFILLLALTAVTVVGHFIWVAIATCFRVMNNSNAERPADADALTSKCILCGTWLSLRRRECQFCGLDQLCSEATRLRELETAARHVAALAEAGEVPQDTADVVLKSLNRRWQQLAEDYHCEILEIISILRLQGCIAMFSIHRILFDKA